MQQGEAEIHLDCFATDLFFMSHNVILVVGLGTAQTLAWASTYYLPAILAVPMARDLGIASATVFAAFSAALVISAFMGPTAGRLIDRFGGRPVLVFSSLVFASGLGLLGVSWNLYSMLMAWLLLGVGMGCGLYEAAFATLVRLQGDGSRASITGITLIAGFASTVGWPLSTWLESEYGWREACLTWAALHVLIGLPLNALLQKVSPAIPVPERTGPSVSSAEGAMAPAAWTTREERLVLGLLAFVFAATWFISTAMAAHLPGLLQVSGFEPGVALMVGMLIGPAQVAGRLLEFGFLRHLSPLLSARIAATLHPLGVTLLMAGAPWSAAAFGVMHGAGNGVMTIAKGTLPLVLFGPQGYGHRQGWLMVPARVAQALAPWLFGLLVARIGTGAFAVTAVVGILASVALWLLPERNASPASASS